MNWVATSFPAGTAGQMGWNNAIAVLDANPATVLTGSNARAVFVSTDSGASWNPSSPVHEDTQFIAQDVGRPGLIYVCNDGGLIRSFDGGATFAPLGNSGCL